MSVDTNDLMKVLNRTNLVDELYRVVRIEKKQLRQDMKEYIWPRLDFLHGQRNKQIYYIFEDQYVETEWKDMVSVHYINTSYRVRNTVMRVHLFLRQEISQESYLGFFTLRDIDEARIMLSYIYPNWQRIRYDSQQLCVMTYKKTVHLMGEKIQFYTYPLFVQDNITVSCSHVNMISMTTYLHQKFDYPKIRILDLNNAFSFGKTKLFPTSGLNPAQMIEIFNSYNIPVECHVFKLSDEDLDNQELAEKRYEQFRSYIDYTIESGIPVILGVSVKDKENGIQRHVVQIIGHTKQDRQNYVIYDDSGYLMKTVFGVNGFVADITWEELKQHIQSENSFILYPVHEKVYIMYDDFKYMFLHMFKHATGLKNLQLEGYLDVSKTRFMVVDNRDIKCFLDQEVLPSAKDKTLKSEIQKLLKQNMPHYVWLCEIPIEGGYMFYIADPTYGKRTSKNVFYNMVPIFSQYQFGLLKYV